MSKSTGAIRLQKEHMQLAKRHVQNKALHNFVASPDINNLYIWYYVIFGLKDCPYEGGYYMGKIIIPKEYPLKPPGIEMITPNGRFDVNKRICMSMSDYHPETWNPLWNIEKIILGLLSFMVQDELTTGCVRTSDTQKKQLAALSLTHNLKKVPKFKELFGQYFEQMEINIGGSGTAVASSG